MMVKKIYGYIPEVESESAYLDDFLPFIESLIISKRSFLSKVRVYLNDYIFYRKLKRALNRHGIKSKLL